MIKCVPLIVDIMRYKVRISAQTGYLDYCFLWLAMHYLHFITCRHPTIEHHIACATNSVSMSVCEPCINNEFFVDREGHQ